MPLTPASDSTTAWPDYGFLSLSFYIGNINGAGRSALRYNRKKHDASVRQLESLNNIFIN